MALPLYFLPFPADAIYNGDDNDQMRVKFDWMEEWQRRIGLNLIGMDSKLMTGINFLELIPFGSMGEAPAAAGVD